jgi:DNA adenine methylase
MTKPFLKWPGNKQKVANIILDKILLKKTTQDLFVEPFAGSCATSLVLIEKDPGFKHYFLNDVNTDLIGSYRQIKWTSEIEDIIEELKTKYFIDQNNSKEKYIELREKFNNKQLTSHQEDVCLFVYLNRHCFNGLIRYNKKGQFNVPFGRYDKINVPEKELRKFHEFCKRKNNPLNVDFMNLSFEQCFRDEWDNAVIYCDPPYFPLSSTSNFVDYSPTENDNWVSPIGSQKKLVELAEEMTSNKNKNNIVAISNHNVPEFRELTKNAKEYHLISVKRNIAANKEDRKTIQEALAIYYA